MTMIIKVDAHSHGGFECPKCQQKQLFIDEYARTEAKDKRRIAEISVELSELNRRIPLIADDCNVAASRLLEENRGLQVQIKRLKKTINALQEVVDAQKALIKILEGGATYTVKVSGKGKNKTYKLVYSKPRKGGKGK